MSERKQLAALAERCGILTAYHGYDGRERVSSDATLEALLDALGFDASSEELAAETLAVVSAEAAQPGLTPVRVARTGKGELGSVELRLPASAEGRVRVELELELEGGGTHRNEVEQHVAADAERTIRVALPGTTELGLGYHQLRCRLEFAAALDESSQDLIVAPPTCLEVGEVVGARRAPGLWTHLYSLRSQRGSGIGDMRDLRTLCTWAAELGLELVGINPLHAVDNTQSDVSPYYPLSRLYRNPIYLDIESAVGRAGAHDMRTLLASGALAAERSALGNATRIDYAGVDRYKLRVLEAVHRAFVRQHRNEDTELGRAYRAYLLREGQALTQFATFIALRERFLAADARNADFRHWQSEYRDPHSDAVQAFAAEQRERIDFHRYLQFELDAQLGSCQQAARAAGMAIGLYGDLALGDAPFSAEAWAQPALYARQVQIGAPPDPFSDSGQDWGLLPFNPLALRADRYRAYRALLQHSLRDMGAVRIDHAMGLTRQFWVPAGGSARDGGYVRFPLEDLLGIVALESRRARTLIVGEDLGVVPDGFRARMAETGLLRSQVLYFEHDPPRSYARAALATVGTHDLPPLRGFFRARDLHERRRAGNIANDAALERALAEREHKIRELLARLRGDGLLPAGDDEPAIEALSTALQLYLASAASRLVAFGLDDLTLELDALNIPAVSLSDAPNWSRRTSLTLEEIMRDPRIHELLRSAVVRAQQE